jgi:PKD repeat protein
MASLTVLNKIVPAANFTMGPALSGLGPLTVSLTNTTTSGTYTSALWRFGNGSTSNTMSSPIQYTYSAVPCSALAQTNPVSLAVTNNGDGTVFTNPAPVVIYPQPTAALAANYSSVATNVTVYFTNSSCYTPGTTNVVWNFGDGSGLLASSAAYVTHSYAASNTYPVTLTVTNRYGYGAVALGNITVTNLPAVSVVRPTSVTIWKIAVQGNDMKLYGSNQPVTANAPFKVLWTNNTATARSNWLTATVTGDSAFNGHDGRFTNTIPGGATNGSKSFFTIQVP